MIAWLSITQSEPKTARKTRNEPPDMCDGTALRHLTKAVWSGGFDLGLWIFYGLFCRISLEQTLDHDLAVEQAFPAVR